MTAEELMDLAKLGGWNVRKLVQTGVDITAEGVTVIENPDKLTLAGIDQLDLCLAALNSHDGNSAFRILLTAVRIVCANTQ